MLRYPKACHLTRDVMRAAETARWLGQLGSAGRYSYPTGRHLRDAVQVWEHLLEGKWGDSTHARRSQHRLMRYYLRKFHERNAADRAHAASHGYLK